MRPVRTLHAFRKRSSGLRERTSAILCTDGESKLECNQPRRQCRTFLILMLSLRAKSRGRNRAEMWVSLRCYRVSPRASAIIYTSFLFSREPWCNLEITGSDFREKLTVNVLHLSNFDRVSGNVTKWVIKYYRFLISHYVHSDIRHSYTSYYKLVFLYASRLHSHAYQYATSERKPRVAARCISTFPPFAQHNLPASDYFGKKQRYKWMQHKQISLLALPFHLYRIRNR